MFQMFLLFLMKYYAAKLAMLQIIDYAYLENSFRVPIAKKLQKFTHLERKQHNITTDIY